MRSVWYGDSMLLACANRSRIFLDCGVTPPVCVTAYGQCGACPCIACAASVAILARPGFVCNDFHVGT